MTEPVSDQQLWSWVDRDAAELRSYLEQHPDEAPRVNRLRTELQALRSLAAPAAAPEYIGPYRVTGLLGAGGMGVVYAAQQQNPRREVAVKVMRERGLAESSLPARFAREATALGRLQHPAIATIHEAGTTAEGVPFLVMERVHGDALTTWATRVGATRVQRVAVLAAIAEGVEAAHRAGVAHRDLKPGNVLVDQQGQPKLVDFGLARLVGDGEGVTLTKPGSFTGTLGYVAPERLEQEALVAAPSCDGPELSEADVRADVYALGVMLFELLTGRLPHPVTGVSLAGLVDAVRSRPTPLPSDTNQDVPDQLDRVTAKALARDPRARYPSARALAIDLRRHLAGQPVSAPPTVRAPAARRWRWIALPTMMLIIGAVTWLATRPAPRLRLAPFDGLVWNADQPEVRIHGEWQQLLAIDAVPVAQIIAACKQRHGEAWRERWLDLETVMAEDGHPLRATVDLQVARLDGSDPRPMRGVPMTAANGAALAQTGLVSVDGEVARSASVAAAFDPRREFPLLAPFVAARLHDGRFEVQLAPTAPFREWLAIDNYDVVELSRICQRAFRRAWTKRLTEDLVQVMTLLGYPIGDHVDLALRDAAGEPELVRGVAMTEQNRQQVRRHN